MNLIPDNIDFSAYMEEEEQYRIIPASRKLEAGIMRYCSFSAYMEEEEQYRIIPASSFLEQTIALFYPPAGRPKFPTMLWDKAKDKIEFRPGEVSLWAGINGHGKSMFLSQVELDLCSQGERVMVASFEMTVPRQMQRMCRQAWAGDQPPVQFMGDLHRWTDGRLWMYDHVGAIEWKKVMAVLRYAHKNFGITHFVVDSLMKCVRGEDDYNGQKDFVNALCAFAQANGVHVHLVHHVRKGESEHKAPGKFDIKGASSVTDLVDNVHIVWRNKNAEIKKTDEPTCIIACEKQRHGEFEGKLGFWFDKASQQYLERVDSHPARYPLKPAKQQH